jgi:hypothetical protein
MHARGTGRSSTFNSNDYKDINRRGRKCRIDLGTEGAKDQVCISKSKSK